jgi:CDP-diglyceride synthetase
MFSAGIYTILSVLIKRVGRQYAPTSPKLILWFFITCDVIATGVQVAGAAMIGVAESNRKDPTTPNNILLAGLAFQVFTFFLFIILLAVCLSRARHSIGRSSSSTDKDGPINGTAPVNWSFIMALVVATLMVYLRTCFRLAETAQGLYGGLSTHEVFFGCLEFAPIVIAVYLFNIWHPGRCIPGLRLRP